MTLGPLFLLWTVGWAIVGNLIGRRIQRLIATRRAEGSENPNTNR